MIFENDLLAFIEQGGYAFMLPLLAMSILSMTVIVERLLALQTAKIIDPSLKQQFMNPNEQPRGDQSTLAGRIVNQAIDDVNKSAGKLAVAAVLEERAQENMAYLTRRLWILSAVGNLAPLLGLLGTVVGLAISFNEIGASGLNQENVASGIGIALITTIAGLIIAIPTLFALHGLRALGERHFEDVRSLLNEFLRWYQVQSFTGQAQEGSDESQ